MVRVPSFEEPAGLIVVLPLLQQILQIPRFLINRRVHRFPTTPPRGRQIFHVREEGLRSIWVQGPEAPGEVSLSLFRQVLLVREYEQTVVSERNTDLLPGFGILVQQITRQETPRTTAPKLQPGMGSM